MVEERAQKWYTINRELVPVKALYFISLAAVGVLLPFISLYMKQIGLSSTTTGIIYGVMPFIGFLARPLIGLVADRLQKHKLVLSICCVLTGLFYLGLHFVPYSMSEHTTVKTNIHCGRNSYIHDCYHVNHSGSVNCPMTFDEYANLSTVPVERETTLNVVSLQNDNLTGSYKYNSDVNMQKWSSSQCTATCHYKAGSFAQTKVCFTNSVEDNIDCVGVSVTLGDHRDWTFTLENMSNIMGREVVQDQQTLGDLVCRDFDLKSITYKDYAYWQMVCDSDVDVECSMKCTKLKEKVCIAMETQDTALTVALFFVFFLFGNIFFAPTLSIADAMTYDILGERRNQYGKQRLWGTIGFALFAVTSTFIMYMLSENPLDTNFTVSFYIFVALFILAIPCIYSLPLSENISCSSGFKDVCSLFRHCQVVIFLIIISFFGILTGVIETFLYWYLSELDGYITLIPGLCLLVACVGETPVLSLSGYIIKRVGHLGCLYFACFAYVLRFIFYSMITNAWHVLPIELLHAITFGLMWPSATSYASIISPPGMSATVQGLISGLHFGFGKGLGSIITGVLITALGFVWTFRLYSLVSFLLLIFYFITNRFFLKEHHNLVQKKSAQDEGSTPGDNSTADVGQNLLSDRESQEMEPLRHSEDQA